MPEQVNEVVIRVVGDVDTEDMPAGLRQIGMRTRGGRVVFEYEAAGAEPAPGATVEADAAAAIAMVATNLDAARARGEDVPEQDMIANLDVLGDAFNRILGLTSALSEHLLPDLLAGALRHLAVSLRVAEEQSVLTAHRIRKGQPVAMNEALDRVRQEADPTTPPPGEAPPTFRPDLIDKPALPPRFKGPAVLSRQDEERGAAPPVFDLRSGAGEFKEGDDDV